MLQRFRALRRNARLYLLSNTLQAITAGAVAVLYTLFLKALGYNQDFIGVVLVVGTIGGGLGILPAAPLVRRIGWRAVLLWSDLIGGVAVAVQLFVPTKPVILITTVGVGASVALFLVVNSPFLAANSSPEERTALFGLSNALGYFAAVIGSLLAGFLPVFFASSAVAGSALLRALDPLLVSGATARSYQLALMVTGAIAVPSIIPIFLLHEEPARQIGADDGGTLSTSPQRVAAAGVHAPAIAPPEKVGPHAGGSGHRERWRKQALHAAAVVWAYAASTPGRFSVTQALVGFGAGIFLPYINLYFVNSLGASTAYYGVVSALLTVTLALASLVSIPLARRFGRLRAAIVAQIVSLPFLLALGVFPVLWVVTGAYLLRGFLMNVTSPPLQTFLMDSVPEDGRVVASNVYNVSFQVAFAVGSAAGGLLITVAGDRASFFAAAPFYALSAVLLLLWFGRQE